MHVRVHNVIIIYLCVYMYVHVSKTNISLVLNGHLFGQGSHYEVKESSGAS